MDPRKILASLIIFLFTLNLIFAQNNQVDHKASIHEEQITFKTYPFSDPNPIPNIGNIYPYFKFDGYTNEAIDKEWKMVVLENDYIKVWVSPEIGGKVWGAMEKSTKKEFLYYNHVVKFRNIAMRGPWTSGGLEFNFGDIGHAPSCSTPVDYKMIENDDGSVSCIVGAYDLPSRTRWNIDIRLPKDAAYLETKVSWFNLTNQNTSYYHWMNAAAKAKGNLEFFYPGGNYIGHGGEVGDWPEKNGREISFYEKNNFGGYKSYHVLNAFTDFFGGYWHDDDFGFGHQVAYDEKPGKKLWIWGLSDQGMIWEDLLTDSDGQYIEYQSGKLFNQAAAGSTKSPFKHKEFGPQSSDINTEIWFPLKETRGMCTANQYAIINLERKYQSASVFISPLKKIKDKIVIKYGDKVERIEVDLNPLELFETTIQVGNEENIEVTIGDQLISYSTAENDNLVERPVEINKDFYWESAYGFYTKALELEKQRNYSEALEEYLNCINKDPGFLPALSRLSLAYYRNMDYLKALEYARKALAIDTYDSEANYFYGLANMQLGNTLDAKSGFSVAALSTEYRSPAYVELAKLALVEKNYRSAIRYSDKALETNSKSIMSQMIAAYANRRSGNKEVAQHLIKEIYKLDPLSDFAAFEEVELSTKSVADFNASITNELPHESFLELASIYLSFGDEATATSVLKERSDHPIVQLWLAHFDEKNRTKHLDQLKDLSAEMVFPFRDESATFLVDFIEQDGHWKLKYYLGLIYWNKGLKDIAEDLFEACGDDPDFGAFYLAKNQISELSSIEKKANLERALEIDPEDWRSALSLSKLLIENDDSKNALLLSNKFHEMYPENSQLGMSYVSSLMALEKYKEALQFLEELNILPFEGSTEGKEVYTYVCNQLAIQALKNKDYKEVFQYAEKSKLWPRNLGVGKPYETDDRMPDFIISLAREMSEGKKEYSALTGFKKASEMKQNANLYLQLLALEKSGMEEMANKLLQSEETAGPSNEIIKWVGAKFNNSRDLPQIQKSLKGSAAWKEIKQILDLLDFLQEMEK